MLGLAIGGTMLVLDCSLYAGMLCWGERLVLGYWVSTIGFHLDMRDIECFSLTWYPLLISQT